jgi:methyl-accepting chemotaxis protein
VKFRFTAPALLIVASIVVVVAVNLIAQLMTGRLVESAHSGDYDLMRRAFTGTLKSMADEASSDAEIFANIPSVRTAFIERDRAKLLGQTERAFKLMEEKYSIDQAQFHTPPGVSFLRLHKPEKFGDDQASYRTMLAEVHQEKGLRKGVDITRSGPAIFGIVPILDDAGKLSGSFEMGLEFGPVLDEMKTQFGLEGAVFFQEKQLQDIATDLPGDIVSPKNRVGRYTRFYATHPKLAAGLVTDKDVDVRTPTSYERTVSGIPYGVQLMPLYNYANKQIGVVAVATSFEEDKHLARRALVWQVLASIFAIILLAGAIIITIRGVLVSPLKGLSERMTALAGGDASRPAEGLESYCEELEGVAKAYEQLRQQRNS